mgnify:CR=1 FL=1
MVSLCCKVTTWLHTINAQRQGLAAEGHLDGRFKVLELSIGDGYDVGGHGGSGFELGDLPLLLSEFLNVFREDGVGANDFLGDRVHVAQVGGASARDHGDAESGLEEGLIPTREAATSSSRL